MRRPFLLAIATLFLVAGCSSNSFVGRRYDNFTAYYNTFYNAKNAYDQGVEGLEQEDQPVDRNLYLPVFSGLSNGRVGSGQAFNDAIEKSADVLREHPNSKWVDDALLLIGKSYFNLQNFVGAEQKFREVMSLGSRLDGEARFWLARTLIAAGQYEAAAEHLEESLNNEDVPGRWRSRLRLAQGELEVQRKDWEAAAQELAQGLTDVPDKELGARAQFLLGQVYETLGAYEEAIAAYEQVQRYKPLYQLSYAAQVSAVRTEGLHGDAEEALRRLRRMERDDKNYDNRAELAYLRGRLYQAQGRTYDALEEYDELLYDSDATITQVAGRTYYALGELYRDLIVDFEVASAYFDTAATRLRSGRNQQQAGSTPPVYTPAAITNAPEQQRIFNSFRTEMAEISRMDSLLALGELDQEAFDAFVLELREQRAEELAEQRREQERQRAEQSFGNFEDRNQRNPVSASNTSSSAESGFLFHLDPVRVQQARAEFELRWGDRPLVPNWRRESALLGAQAALDPSGNAVPDSLVVAGEVEAGEDELPEVDISAVPRTPEAQAIMREERSVVWYELANVLFLSMNRPDSAAAWYRLVIDESGDLPVAQRAYYALAEVQQALQDSVSARELYRTITERYPDSEFANRAREQIGLPVIEVVETDSVALAESAYQLAYASWQDHQYASALDHMVTLAAAYQRTDIAPKALFAAGRIYQEWSVRDSLDLFAPLPLGLPDSVLLAIGLLEPPPPPDTTQVADSTLALPLPAVPDSLTTPALVPSDSLAQALDDAGADSLSQAGMLPDSARVGAAPVDSLIVPVEDVPPSEPEPVVPDSVRLQTLYTNIIQQYPRSPQADQAKFVLTALEEYQAALQAQADSILALSADSLDVAAVPDMAVDSTDVDSMAVVVPIAMTDSTASLSDTLAVAQDMTEEPEDSAEERRRAILEERQERRRTLIGENETRALEADGAEEALSPPPTPAPSPTPAAVPMEMPLAVMEEHAGEWTIIAIANNQRQMAEAFVQRLRSLYQPDALPVYLMPFTDESGKRSFQVVVGFYPSQEAAASARATLRDLPPAEQGGASFRQIIAPRR